METSYSFPTSLACPIAKGLARSVKHNTTPLQSEHQAYQTRGWLYEASSRLGCEAGWAEPGLGVWAGPGLGWAGLGRLGWAGWAGMGRLAGLGIDAGTIFLFSFSR